MLRPHILRILAVSLLLASGAVLTPGCGAEPPELGPKPAMYASESASKSQMADNMRAWLKTLKPRDAETLGTTGQIVFSREELRASDPLHAQMVDDYVRSLQAGITDEQRAKARAAGFQLPGLAPQSVSFRRQCDRSGRALPGAYELVIELGGGNFTNLPLSDPL